MCLRACMIAGGKAKRGREIERDAGRVPVAPTTFQLTHLGACNFQPTTKLPQLAMTAISCQTSATALRARLLALAQAAETDRQSDRQIYIYIYVYTYIERVLIFGLND